MPAKSLTPKDPIRKTCSRHHHHHLLRPQPQRNSITVASESTPRSYSHVISTIPFCCLRTVDTTQCGFNWALQTTLEYDNSVKVAIPFSAEWWEDPELRDGMGGVIYG